MMRIRWNRTGLLAALCLAALLSPAGVPAALAQAGGPPPGRGPQGPPGPAMGPDGEEGDDLVETVEIYMLAKMKRALDLSREQEEKMVPLVQELGEARRTLHRTRRLSIMKLRPLVEETGTPDSAFTKILAEMRDSETAFREREERTHQEIASVLSPRQQAQFLLFQEKFQMEMQQRLRRLRGMRGQGPPDGAGGPGPGRRRVDPER